MPAIVLGWHDERPRPASVLTTPLAKVREEIARACVEARRDPAAVTLVAISKTFDADAIEPVIAAGQRVFGENRVQEAKAKWPALIARHPGIELHLVGPLQSNKAKEAVALFDAIHSVDRPSLPRRWRRRSPSRAAAPRCSSRSIPAPSRRRPACCRRRPMRSSRLAARRYGLAIAGLMCIPPAR